MVDADTRAGQEERGISDSHNGDSQVRALPTRQKGFSITSCKQAVTFNSLTVKHIQQPRLFKDVVEQAYILLYLVVRQRCMHKQNHMYRLSQDIHLYC